MAVAVLVETPNTAYRVERNQGVLVCSCWWLLSAANLLRIYPGSTWRVQVRVRAGSDGIIVPSGSRVRKTVDRKHRTCTSIRYSSFNLDSAIAVAIQVETSILVD